MSHNRVGIRGTGARRAKPANRIVVRAVAAAVLAVGVIAAAATAASAVNSIKADGVNGVKTQSVGIHSDVNSI